MRTLVPEMVASRMEVKGAVIRAKVGLMLTLGFSFNRDSKAWERGTVSVTDTIYRKLSYEALVAKLNDLGVVIEKGYHIDVRV